jgi:DNA polymerase-3 subunit delta
MEISSDAACLLVEATNAEAARIQMEIEKLSLYAQGTGKIAMKDVESLVVSARKYTVWEFGELLVDARRDEALVFLEGLLRDGEQPPQIIGALAWMYRKLIEARELSPRINGYQATRQLQMNSESAERAIRQSRKFSLRQLTGGLAALADADNLLKSGVADPRAAMEFLITQLATGAAVQSRPSAA